MKIHTLFHLSLLTVILFTWSCQSSAESQEKKVHWGWPEEQPTQRPFTRWWWMGNAVDSANLKRLLQQYDGAGLGGVEIAPIYGAMGFEDRYLDYLSPDWMNALRFTTRQADALGMAVDMTLGTGWPYGGPQLSLDQAASKLFFKTYEVGPQGLKEQIKVEEKQPGQYVPPLVALTAYHEDEPPVNLMDQVDAEGYLNWKPKQGNWKVFAALMGKTGQRVKRAAPGGDGYTMDHLSKDALSVYLQRFDSAFAQNPPKIRSFFNDSYEVYNADFSPALFDAFQDQQGYDLRLHIRALAGEENTEEARRVLADYRETMSKMLLENFTLPWTDWAHQHGALSRNQAHGSPANLLDLYAAVDIPETETFGSTNFPIKGLNKYTDDQRNVEPDPIMMKFASSGAHIMGKTLTSSETFTWLGEHFKVSLAQGKPELEQLFLAGINHVFFHGTTYSPEDANWPGWLFYASVNMAPSNSQWPHLNGLTEYIRRCQSVLQAGEADSDILVYWPVYDLWQQKTETPDMPLTIHHIEDWLHPTSFYQNVKLLEKSGYLTDFISDHLLDSLQVIDGHLQASPNSQYQTVVVPSCEYMPVKTLEKLISLAEQGGTIIFRQLPGDVPGLNDLQERRERFKDLIGQLKFEEISGTKQMKTGEGRIILTENLVGALQSNGIFRESMVDSGLKFIRRKIGQDTYYYVVNHTAKDVDQNLTLQTCAKSVLLLDPQTGTEGLGAMTSMEDSISVRIQLASGKAIILQTSQEEHIDTKRWRYIVSEAEAITLTKPWRLHFEDGGPVLPQDQYLNKLTSWTNLPDSDAARFSGTASYTTQFTLNAQDDDDYLLKLHDVRESARVWINGQEVGILWSVPYQIRIGEYLEKGENEIKIEVANLMANRIIDLDKRKVAWRKYHEINFVTLAYEPFDASSWVPQPSGLLGPVEIVPVRYNIENGS